MGKNHALEIEVDGARNEQLYFRPLGRSIRGRFEFQRVGEPMASVVATSWPSAIPSQIIGIDPSGDGYIVEPLHNDEHAATKDQIEKQGMKLEPKITMFEDIDRVTWQFWLKAAVESGIAKVVSGRLPDEITGTPRLDFITDRKPEIEERLTNALEKQNELFEKLLEKLAEKE